MLKFIKDLFQGKTIRCFLCGKEEKETTISRFLRKNRSHQSGGVHQRVRCKIVLECTGLCEKCFRMFADRWSKESDATFKDLFGDLVCVLCGRDWSPPIINRCTCGGFCTWGPAKGADPSSWIKTEGGYVPRPPSSVL